MPTPLKRKVFDRPPNKVEVWYRPNTTDEEVLREVVEKRSYRRSSVGFDVNPGERWLDLGANIGAFAAYCALRGATCTCYEPEPGCFQLLEKNLAGFGNGFVAVRAAVSGSKEPQLDFWSSSLKGNHYRGTLLNVGMRTSAKPVTVPNCYAGDLGGRWDGIKMDIEGGEFVLLDQDLLPPTRKLCFEYHTSRDQSMTNLGRRLQRLKRKYEVVAHVPELSKMVAAGGYAKSFHDRIVYCLRPKSGQSSKIQ